MLTTSACRLCFSKEEKLAIDEAMDQDDPWGYNADDPLVVEALKKAKNKILEYQLERHSYHCCYCRKSLRGEGHFITDREHILPKGKAIFKPYSFIIWNLAAACKRCNMRFKGQKTEFLNNSSDVTKFQLSDNYRFVHPNFDRFEDHLISRSKQYGTAHVIAFVVEDTPKAIILTLSSVLTSLSGQALMKHKEDNLKLLIHPNHRRT